MEFETATAGLAFTYAAQGIIFGGFAGGLMGDTFSHHKQSFLQDGKLTEKSKKILKSGAKGAVVGLFMGAAMGASMGASIDEMHEARRALETTTRQDCLDKAPSGKIVVYTPPSIFTKPACAYE